MHVIQLIQGASARLYNSVAEGNGYVVSRSNQIREKTSAGIARWYQQEWAQTNVKPLYERHIKPLNKSDFDTGSRVLGAALITSFVAILFWGATAVPLAACASAILMGIWWTQIVQGRIQHQSNLQARQHVDSMIGVVSSMTPSKNDFTPVITHRMALKAHEFDHLRDTFKELEEQTRIFQEALLAAKYDEKKDRGAFLEYLKGLQKNLPSPPQPLPQPS